LNFLLDTGSHGTVANVSVNFYQIVAPDDHRFALWMVDVGGNDRAAASDFRAHELGRDRFGNARAEGFATILYCRLVGACGITAEIFANGDKFHFRGDDALP